MRPPSISPRPPERPRTDGDRVQVSTAPGPTASSAASRCAAARPAINWAVFALANTGDEQIDRLIVVPHYRMVGSGLFWPDLGLSRVVNSHAERGRASRAAGFRRPPTFSASRSIPASVITYVLELRTDNLPQLYLWEPDAYKDKINSFTLYYGIVIGIAGLLALFLTILFVVKGRVMFPAAAALGWAVLVLYRHRFRILGQGVRHVGRRRAHLARDRRMRCWPRRCSSSCSPISISAAGTCATRTSPSRWLGGLAALIARRAVRSGGRVRHRALLAGRRRRSLGFARRGPTVDARLRPRGAADPDLVPAGASGPIAAGLTVTGVVTQRHHRPGAARRPGADRDADRLHGDAARLRGRRSRTASSPTSSAARWR